MKIIRYQPNAAEPRDKEKMRPVPVLTHSQVRRESSRVHETVRGVLQSWSTEGVRAAERRAALSEGREVSLNINLEIGGAVVSGRLVRGEICGNSKSQDACGREG